MNLDETNIIKLTHYAGDQGAYEPDFSPDGQKVVFRISNSTTVGLYAMNPDGSDIKPLLVDEYKNKGLLKYQQRTNHQSHLSHSHQKIQL
jgi:Tol biopolymer transport system component